MALSAECLDSKKETKKASFELGDLLVSYLQQLSIDYVFGVPGGAIEPFYNALARSAKKGNQYPQSVLARHEAGAAFMASGYAQRTGKLGVCCATTGPGATNLITGVASAYESDVPLLVITAQTARSAFGRGPFQDSSCAAVDTVGMFKHCTHYSTLVSHPEQLEYKLITALVKALKTRGPAHLSIPLDVLRTKASSSKCQYDLRHLISSSDLLNVYAVELLAEELKGGKSVFVLGEGCEGAVADILAIANLLAIPILTTPHGKGFVDPHHPLYRGVIGFAGHATAKNILTTAEIKNVIAVGTNFGECTTDCWGKNILLDGRLIHIDQNLQYLARSPMAKLHVHGAIPATFKYLLRKLKTQGVGSSGDNGALKTEKTCFEAPRCFQFDDEDKYYANASPIKPQQLMRALSSLFPSGTKYLADTGNSMAWAIHYLNPSQPPISHVESDSSATVLICPEFASMGWAIGAAIGVALANAGKPVVCITGDGSMLMSGQELTVAIQMKLPIIFVVLNDSALGMVKHGQQLGGGEPIAFELPRTDFSLHATASGACAHSIFSPEDLLSLDINEICCRKGPTLLDVYIDPEEVPPIGARVRALTEKEPCSAPVTA